MARAPRGLRQAEVIRALVRAGGKEDRRAGNGSHRRVTMPNGVKVFVPAGRLKVGTLQAIVRQAGLEMGDFMRLL